MDHALDDITVVSFAQLAQGPLATQMLGDMGAEVIKIERPKSGEWMRNWSMANRFPGDESASWLSVNRNKRSVELDLKDEGHQEVVYDLIEEADVLVENFRPGVMDRLGFGYEELSKTNEGLIYCSASGYGEEGPYSERPGQDLIIQGISGLMSITGSKDNPPTPLGTAVVDYYTAAYLAFSILAALHYRERTGKGQKVEGDLLSTAVSFLAEEVSVYANGGEDPERSDAGIAHVYNQAPYGVYETEDGYLTLSLSPPAEVGEALNIDKIKDIADWEEAYERRDEIKETIEEELQTEPTEYWMDLLWEYGIWCGPVNSIPEMVDHPQVEENDMIVDVEHPTAGTIQLTGIPVRFSETPGDIRRHPPLLGEHTEEIIEDLREE